VGSCAFILACCCSITDLQIYSLLSSYYQQKDVGTQWCAFESLREKLDPADFFFNVALNVEKAKRWIQRLITQIKEKMEPIAMSEHYIEHGERK
jgi:hypothetical protein